MARVGWCGIGNTEGGKRVVYSVTRSFSYLFHFINLIGFGFIGFRGQWGVDGGRSEGGYENHALLFDVHFPLLSRAQPAFYPLAVTISFSSANTRCPYTNFHPLSHLWRAIRRRIFIVLEKKKIYIYIIQGPISHSTEFALFIYFLSISIILQN